MASFVTTTKYTNNSAIPITPCSVQLINLPHVRLQGNLLHQKLFKVNVIDPFKGMELHHKYNIVCNMTTHQFHATATMSFEHIKLCN